MYFGSVKFFKHVIIIIVLLGITIPAVMSVLLWQENEELKIKLAKLSPEVTDTTNTTTADNDATPPETLNTDNDIYITDPPTDSTTTTDSNTDDTITDVTDPVLTDKKSEFADLFPELKADYVAPTSYLDDENYIYLTFDDGPSINTESILSYLSTYNIKATFFVMPKDTAESASRLKRIADAGHVIGIHTFTHEYTEVYANVSAFLADYSKAYNLIVEQTGIVPYLYRFPGGSINDYNALVREDIIAEMSRRGFVYYDWNVDSRDSMGATWTEMYNTVLKETAAAKRAVILFHDRGDRRNTVYVLEDVIKAFQQDKRGYKFSAITPATRPMQF